MGVPPPFGPLAGLFILVVDDNDDARHILEALLTYLGALVSTAPSADATLRILGQVKADVIVCDVNLGEQDALWLIERAREHQVEAPFIAISGQDYDEREIQAAGFIAYLRKPVRQDVLVSKILGAVGR